MPSLFKRLAEYTFYLLAIVLVALASLTSAIRYSPEFSNVVAERIEVHLGDLSKMAVDVESLEIGADGLSLYLVARNVNFQSLDKADRSWQIDQISISPAVFKSIIKQRLLLSEIVLQGLDLELLRDQQGQIHVNQFFVIPEQATPQKSSFWSELQLRVLATNIHWQDELLQVDYHFNDVNASVDPVGQGVAIFFSAGLPDELGKRIVLHAEMDEGLTDFRQAGIDFHWEIQDIQLAAVAEKITDIDGERINTSLNSEAWGRLDGMRLNALRGSVELSQLMTESSLNSYDRCLSEDYINQISMNYVWSRDANDWDVLLDDIKIQTEQEAWPTTSARLSLVEHNSTARTVKAFISYLDIGAL